MLDKRATDDLYPPTVPPSARALPLLLHLTKFVRNPLRALPRAVYEQPIVTYGRKKPLATWVTGPDLIEHILIKRSDVFVKTRLDKRVLRPLIGTGILTADGDEWRWQRKLASPLFRPGDAMTYVPQMVEAANEQVARWQTKGAHTANIEAGMTDTTFAVLARTILVGINEQQAADIQRTGHTFIQSIMWSVASALLLLPETWWHPGRKRMLAAAAEARRIVQKLIDMRRADGIEGDDLIARMLKARNPDTGEPMTDDQLVDNLGTFLLAGHETTAKALTWTLYLIARSPEWQNRVRQEVRTVTGGEAITAEHVAKLHITQRVLKEAMRLYPPVPAMTRVNREPAEIAGIAFPDPALIVIPIYAVHRHKALWDNPDKFDPDRFLPEREAQMKRTQFMPFGAGPRVCIGAAFAMVEATVVLATLVASTRFEWDGHHLPEPVSRITLHPKGSMPLHVTPLSPADRGA